MFLTDILVIFFFQKNFQKFDYENSLSHKKKIFDITIIANFTKEKNISSNNKFSFVF